MENLQAQVLNTCMLLDFIAQHHLKFAHEFFQKNIILVFSDNVDYFVWTHFPRMNNWKTDAYLEQNFSIAKWNFSQKFLTVPATDPSPQICCRYLCWIYLKMRVTESKIMSNMFGVFWPTPTESGFKTLFLLHIKSFLYSIHVKDMFDCHIGETFLIKNVMQKYGWNM